MPQLAAAPSRARTRPSGKEKAMSVVRGLDRVLRGTIYGPSPHQTRKQDVMTKQRQGTPRLTQQLKHVIGVLPHLVLTGSRVIPMCREVSVVSRRRTRKHALLNPVLPQVDPRVEPRRIRRRRRNQHLEGATCAIVITLAAAASCPRGQVCGRSRHGREHARALDDVEGAEAGPAQDGRVSLRAELDRRGLARGGVAEQERVGCSFRVDLEAGTWGEPALRVLFPEEGCLRNVCEKADKTYVGKQMEKMFMCGPTAWAAST